MAFVILHKDTGKLVARKDLAADSWRLTNDYGEVQLFKNKGAANGTITGLKKDFKHFREFAENEAGEFDCFGERVPTDNFTIHYADIVVGDPAD